MESVDMLRNSSSSSASPLVHYCSRSAAKAFISAGMILVKVVVLVPLCTFILYLGRQRWRQQRSFQAVSHCDLFTYHLSAMELFWVPGMIGYFCGEHTGNQALFVWGIYNLSVTHYGETLFHLLTCVERYLAVVHPVTYLGLRNARGLRTRALGSVWMLCFGMAGFHVDLTGKYVMIAMLSFFVVVIAGVTFCSISVLCVLARPGPGGDGRGKRQINRSKLKAFHTIAGISCVLWLWFGPVLVGYTLSVSSVLSESVDCVLNSSLSWLSFPSMLLLPLLYLHREGKLRCI